MNGKSKTGEPCIICLNEHKTHQMRGIDCECKYYIHQSCHIEYMNHKAKMECPICHMVSMENPFFPHSILYKKEQKEDNSCVNGCIGGCCCYLIIGAILAAVFG